MNDFLEKILAAKQTEIDAAKSEVNMLMVKEKALQNNGRGFRAALSDKNTINVIAEYKKASPSKGDIRLDIAPADQAKAYQAGGAAAMSVLTEADYFKGSLDDMLAARAVVDIPVLRKDFTIDGFQILESAAAGCDAVLLITRILSDQQLSDFIKLAKQCGMDPLVEIFDEDDLARAQKAGADLIGINNRDLVTFEVDNDNAVRLSRMIDWDCVVIAASGVSSCEDVKEAYSKGLNNYLIGETLMRSDNPTDYLKKINGVINGK